MFCLICRSPGNAVLQRALLFFSLDKMQFCCSTFLISKDQIPYLQLLDTSSSKSQVNSKCFFQFCFLVHSQIKVVDLFFFFVKKSSVLQVFFSWKLSDAGPTAAVQPIIATRQVVTLPWIETFVSLPTINCIS